MLATETATATLRQFLADHAICRVWHTGHDAPAGDEVWLDTEAEGEDYCDGECLLSVLTDWLTLNLDDLTGTVSCDEDGEHRWTWDGEGSRRNCRGNSLYQLVVWGD